MLSANQNQVQFFYVFLQLCNSVFAERGLEIGVLQDNADVLKSKNIPLNEEAQALSLQMTMSLQMLLTLYRLVRIKCV